MKLISFLLLVSLSSFGQGGGFPPSSNPFDGGSTGQMLMKNSNGMRDWAWSTYFGSSSIQTLGTVTTGTWQGSIVGATYGGTGVNNGSRTLTINSNSGTINFSGASKTLTVPLDASVSGTNTGDQTSIVGITGTFAQFNTAVTDADFARSDAANTFTGVQTFSSAPVFSTGTATVGGNTITFPVVAATLLPNTTTSGVGSSPTSSSTQTITHNLGRIPTIIRIYGAGTFTSNAAATATTFTTGTFNSTGNRCVYQGYNTAAITTTQASATSTTFAIALYTGANNFVTGVIQNVTSTQFDIVWTETGTATAQNYLWEAQ